MEFPVSGDSLVLRPPGHGRWAFDVLPLDPTTGRVANGSWWRYMIGGLRASDVSGWGREVASPVDGEVVAAHDGETDASRLVPWRDVPMGMVLAPLLRGRRIAAMAGNHVIIGANGSYVLLAHLRRGSVRVRPGDAVHAGQVLASIGFSGNALGPHLHLQVMDGPDPLAARLVPFSVRQFQFSDGTGWQERRNEVLPATRSRIRVQAP